MAAEASPASKVALGTLTVLGLALKVDHLLPFSVETVAMWAVRLVIGLIAFILLLFLLIQVLWTWRTEGAKSVLVLLFTSFVIFPPLIVAECVEHLFFAPKRDRTKNKTDSSWGGGAIQIAPGTMCAMDGIVTHSRSEQAHNAFAYRVRYYLLNLDSPPPSFRGDHMSADEARAFAATDGPVLLLTDPASAGYHQNPISVYYCYSKGGLLLVCIAEVTNTPWGERVTFLFHPKMDVVPKSLHVSPFLDMNRSWQLEASDPCTLVASGVGHPANERAVGQQPNDKARAIHIACVHPSGGGKQGRNESQVVGKEAAGEAGAERRYTSKPSCYTSKPSCHTRVVLAASMRLSVTCLPNCEGGAPFYAVLKMEPSGTSVSPGGWLNPTSYFVPQRVALRIYWQAFKLILKGVRYCPHPNEYDNPSYETLVARPSTLARSLSALASRNFMFREFLASGARTTRMAVCPCGMAVDDKQGRPDKRAAGAGAEEEQAACPVSGARGRGRGGVVGDGRRGAVRMRSPGRRPGGKGGSVDGRGREGGMGKVWDVGQSKMRYYDGSEWRVGH